MKIIIEHRKTKREINGAFNFYMLRKDMIKLKYFLESKLSDQNFYSGWFNFPNEIKTGEMSDFDLLEIQKSIPNTPPTSWD